MEPEAVERPRMGSGTKMVLLIVGALLVVGVLWWFVGMILGWVFGILKLVLFVALVIGVAWVALKVMNRGD